MRTFDGWGIRRRLADLTATVDVNVHHFFFFTSSLFLRVCIFPLFAASLEHFCRSSGSRKTCPRPTQTASLLKPGTPGTRRGGAGASMYANVWGGAGRLGSCCKCAIRRDEGKNGGLTPVKVFMLCSAFWASRAAFRV